MSKSIKIAILLSLCWPFISLAQLCKPESIPVSTPSGQFTDQGNGTVTDTKTGLMWKKCSEGQNGNDCSGMPQTFTWQEALQHATALNNSGGFAGKTDWRLPNIKELRSIVEIQCVGFAINMAVFPRTSVGWYWSSSPYAGNDNYAWSVSFTDGSDYSWDKYNNYIIRLVRSGK